MSAYHRLLKEKFSNTTAEFAMSRFAEAVAENVFNGIFSDFNQDMRKQHSM